MTRPLKLYPNRCLPLAEWLLASQRGATLLEALEFAAGITAKVIAKAGAIVDLD